MKRIIAPMFAVSLAALPAALQAEEPPQTPPRGDTAEGLSLVEEGMKLLLFGLLKDADELRVEIEGKLIEFSEYEMPEFLPNGDIIIRRKVPIDPEAAPMEPPKEGQIDL